VARFLALLRAVNVGGRKLPMAELKALCGELGWSDVATYIQSGNLLFSAPGKPAELEAQLERAIAARFGYHSDVMIRSTPEWARLVAENPFPEAAEAEPNRLLAGLAKHPIAPGAADAIAARAAAGERVAQTADALWFHYAEGVGTSKITPALIDKAAGSPVTARNWRTLLKLKEMLEA